MSRKTSSRSASPASTSSTKSGARAKLKTFESFPKPSKPPVPAKLVGKPAAASVGIAKPPPGETQQLQSPQQETSPKGNGIQPAAATTRSSAATSQLLNRAERDITSAIESLNNQMNRALTALAELASAQSERGKAVVRTAPLDRATATFQRLVAEVVDDQLTEMLPPLIALRNETGQWAASGEKDSAESDFHRRGLETLDHVLTLAGVTSFDARSGQTFDPLIHLAVGECRRDDLADNVVAECLQPGFRSSRGKVLSQARVRINRR